MRILRSMLIVSSVLLSPAAQAQEEVDLELVLLADASSSIDDTEVVFQRRGYAVSAEVFCCCFSSFEKNRDFRTLPFFEMLSFFLPMNPEKEKEQ